MRILISAAMMISDYKIKTKSDEAHDRTFSKILIKNYMILINSLNETTVDQEVIFSSVNMIIIEKIIFVTDVIF